MMDGFLEASHLVKACSLLASPCCDFGSSIATAEQGLGISGRRFVYYQNCWQSRINSNTEPLTLMQKISHSLVATTALVQNLNSAGRFLLKQKLQFDFSQAFTTTLLVQDDVHILRFPIDFQFFSFISYLTFHILQGKKKKSKKTILWASCFKV